MKFASLHKSRRQISSRVSYCLIVILATISNGFADVLLTNESGAFGPSLTWDHPDACFIESLLNAKLFDVAIETCRSRHTLSSATQPDAAAQWSMLEMHAIAAKSAADPRIINEPSFATNLLSANQVILDRNLDSPRLLWLKKTQLACRWIVLRRMQAAYIAVPARVTIRDWSLASIRECLNELEILQSEIQKAPARDSKSNKKGTSTTEQWSSLTNDLTLLQTDFLLLRALYYASKSRERIGAATEILTALDKAELRIGSDWPGRPNIDLARFTAYIHLDRPKDALDGIVALDKKLKTTTESKPRPSNRWRLRIATLAAEACRNLGNMRDSNQWLESVGGWTVSPEIAIEHFANVVTLPAGQSATDAQFASALKVKEAIGARFGSYWQQRAEAILLATYPSATTEALSISSSPTSMFKVELLKSEAIQLLSAKRIDEGLEKLSQAEVSAANGGNESLAMEMAFNAAIVLSSNDRKQEAEGEFHRAAMTYSGQPNAPDYAIMSVVGFVKAIAFDVSGKPLSPDEEAAELKQQIYRGRLMDIVNTWPGSDQAVQALMKLDRLLLATNQTPELIALWSKRLDQKVGDAKRKGEYDQALSRYVLIAIATQDAWFDRSIYNSGTMKKIRPALDEWKSKLIRFAGPNDENEVRSILEAIGDASRWPNANANNRNLEGNRAAPSAVAYLLPFALQTSPLDLEALHSALDKAKLDATTQFSLRWCATELMFQQLIQNGVRKPIASSEVDNLKQCVNRLGEFRAQAAGTIGQLQSNQLDRSLRLYLAAVQCWSGEEAKGLSTIEGAIAAEPKVPWWTYRSARLLQTIASQRAQAIRQFRQLAKGLPEGGEAWLDARARTSQTMRLMGETDEAKKLAEVVFAAYPIAAKEWQSRFER